MLKFYNLNENEITKIITILKEEKLLSCALPGGGLLHIEPELPYMVVYRPNKNKNEIKRIVVNEASYLLIGNKDFKKFQRLIIAISDLLSAKYKSYLVLELFLSDRSQNNFTIKGPKDILPSFLKTLKHELRNIENSEFGKTYDAIIENTIKRHPKGKAHLLTIDKAKQCGALMVGLEIPPAFYNEKGAFFPIYFRKFREAIIDALHIAIYEYIRVQTSCGVQSYLQLGRKSLKQKVFDMDRELAKIERSYKFLWLISPSNIYNIKQAFFESDYNKILDYHYRLLPIDPDILKRKLYGLKIEDIDDPAMSHLYRQKREELDHQISMLSERGNSNFFYSSIKLYQGIDSSLFENAKAILKHLPEEIENNSTNKHTINALEFSTLARNEFDFLKMQDVDFKSRIHIRKDVNIMMVNQGELYIPADYKANITEAKALIQHEVGTHILTYFNGRKQPLQQLSVGLADYDTLQEGIAVMSEYLSGGLTVNRLRILAGRVIAGKALMDGYDFRGIFRLLFIEYGFTKERSFNITSRIMQGGGFLKDIIYLKGLVNLRYFLSEGGAYEVLFTGKFAFNHINIIKELIERKVLHKGTLMPSYLNNKLYIKKLQKIREGLPIHEMAIKQEDISHIV